MEKQPPVAPAQPPSMQASAPVAPNTPRAMLSLEQAREVLTTAAKTSPQDPLPLLELALFERKANNPQAAEQLLIETWRKFPKFSRAPYHLGMLYLAKKDVRAALPPLQAASRLAPEDPVVQVNAGFVLVRAGLEEEARQCAENAKRIDPEMPDIYLLLSYVNDHHGTAADAITFAQEYVKRSTNPAPGLYMMGRTYARQGNGADAEKWLKRALETSPDNPEVLLTLGRIYYEIFKTTRSAEAIPLFEKVVALTPNDWEGHLWLGRARMSQERWEEAVLQLRDALRLAPQPGSVYYDLGQALLKAGIVEEGRKMLATYQEYRTYTQGVTQRQTAISKDPKNRTLRVELAQFCIKYRQYPSALNILKSAERDMGTNAQFAQLRAEAERGLGDALAKQEANQ